MVEMVDTRSLVHEVVVEMGDIRGLVGQVVKASALRVEDPGFESRLRRDFSVVESLQWLPGEAPGVIGSVLGLVDPVSVYCDWVRWKV